MFTNRLFNLFVLAALLLITACAPQVAATPNATSIPVSASATAILPIPDEPITLHLAVSDAQGRASEPYVLEFVDEVKNISNGKITIVPTWDAGAEITPPIEE